MSLFIVQFTDKPERLKTRDAFLQPHIAWLDAHRESVLVAGSLRDERESAAIGGLWIVQADNKASVKELIQTDPFWIEGLRDTVRILHWSKAFQDRQVLV